MLAFIPIFGTRSQPRGPVMTAQETVAEGTVHGRFDSRLIVRCRIRSVMPILKRWWRGYAMRSSGG